MGLRARLTLLTFALSNAVWAQNVTEFLQDEATTLPPQDDDVGDYGVVPEVVLNSEAGAGIGQSSEKHLPTTIFDKVALHLFKKLSPGYWLRPLSEKVSKISDFIALAHHPNFGGVQWWNPQNLWEKLHQKGDHFLTGPHGAVYGTAHHQQVDYPFAYRNFKEV